MSAEQIGTGPQKPATRGLAAASLELIEAAQSLIEPRWPISVRGACYQLFAAGHIPSMARSQTKRVSRLLVKARETGMIPWEWIVDEHRAIERSPSWRDPAAYVQAVRRSYRRNFWNEQPSRVQVWSEKGTVRGVVAPTIDADYGVGFLSVGGFNSATTVQEAATGYDGRPLIVLYIGDWDPSGLFMSERDLPDRLERYGGTHITLRRIALLRRDTAGLPSFSAHSKKADSRYNWFTENFGDRCWELDAMDPNDLRARVKESIEAEIEPEAWRRCAAAQEAEQESLKKLLDEWVAA